MSVAEPLLSFPEELPISARVDDIRDALANNQVVVVAGETGSGKTTQLPKICLQLGFKKLAHTQPRRIAARTVAERLAEEMDTEVGDLVGYQVRFTTKASRQTRVKVLTDGVLLAEINHDRDLRRYDCIIIDEAHERSLNIDFLLGYLKQLLPRRPDLKVVITSATIDTERFANHFSDSDGRTAPIVEVSGRTYPVEIRYRPLTDDPDTDEADDEDGAPRSVVAEQRDQVEGIVDACEELLTEGGGDILVFLAGERDIRDTAEALQDRKFRFVEVLPLYARLSAAEQHRVFTRHTGTRIVLATNVAETSLTVPGIRYVVDPGTARISRYSARTKVQRLPIEEVSQASANQRSGRCGRVAPGIAIRLYSQRNFESRPEFTEPEILRTNLASVILQMADVGLGDIEAFPFVEPPDHAQVRDGLRLLDELGALQTARKSTKGEQPTGTVRLTPIGRQLSRIPLDPRMARMLVEAEKQGCLREMMVIVAGLTIADPRERPQDKKEEADRAHRRFWAPMPGSAEDGQTRRSDGGKQRKAGGAGAEVAPTPDGSDFIAWLRLWEYLRERRNSLSGNAFRRMCRDEYLNFLRVREWQDLHQQLRDITRSIGLRIDGGQSSKDAENSGHGAQGNGADGGGADKGRGRRGRGRRSAPGGPADSAAIHTAVLSGLLSHVGLADIANRKPEPRSRKGRRGPTEYLGARGMRFAINPGSSVAKAQPELVVAGELVETSRLWARTVAGVESEWIEQVGGHLLKRTYSEPHWSAASGSVVASEKVTLLGVPIIVGRRVGYGRIDPVEAREVFIRSALVEGDWRARHEFHRRNADVRRRAEELEERTRRRDLVVDDDALFSFYDRRIPAKVVSTGHFEHWWREASRDDPHLLDLSLDDLLVDEADPVSGSDFPDRWTVGEHELEVGYLFDPGAGQDGVTVTIPLSLLNQIPSEPFSWQVPGLRRELTTALIRSLPKAIRTRFVPAPDFAVRALQRIDEDASTTATAGTGQQDFTEVLARTLTALTGDRVRSDDFGEVPGHLRPGFRVVDPSGKQVGAGKDLTVLRRQLSETLSSTLTRAMTKSSNQGAAPSSTSWNFGTLEQQVSVQPKKSRRGGRPSQTPRGPAAVGYPGLVDRGDAVALRVHESAATRLAEHRLGLRRLVTLNTPDPTKWVVAHLPNADKLALGSSPYSGVPALLADARLASVGQLIDGFVEDPLTIRDEATFASLCDRVRADNADRMREIVQIAAGICRTNQEVQLLLRAADAQVAADVTEQLDNLLFDGFIAATDRPHLDRLPVYLRAAKLRLEALPGSLRRDRQASETVMAVEDEYAELCAAQPPGRLPAPIEQIGWMIEELRVSLFAQQLGTSGPISAKRVRKAIAEAERAR